jgi:hypothetical protein
LNPDLKGSVDPKTENQDGPSKIERNKDILSLEQLNVPFYGGLE